MSRLSVTAVNAHAFAELGTVIVVPARNEEERIGYCLSHLFAQDAPIPAGIVLCVNNTTDETAARTLAQARSRRHPLILAEATFASGGVGRARRLGHRIAMRAAPQATVFLSTDADCLPAPCWQREMEAVLARAPAVLGRIDVCGRELASFPASVLLRQRQENAFAALAMEFERLMDPAGPDGIGLNTAGGANLGFRRAAYRSVGGYRPLETGEDRDIIDRVRAAGFRPLRAENAVVLASMRRDGRAPGGMADQIVARFQRGDCSVDSALAPFEVMVARHLGHNAVAPRLTLAGARGDLQALQSCVEALRLLACVESRRRYLADLTALSPVLGAPLATRGASRKDNRQGWNCGRLSRVVKAMTARATDLHNRRRQG